MIDIPKHPYKIVRVITLYPESIHQQKNSTFRQVANY